MLKIKKSEINEDSAVNHLIDIENETVNLSEELATNHYQVTLMPPDYEVVKEKQKMKFTSEFLKRVANNTNEMFDRDLIVDFEHLAFEENAGYEEKKALGWIKAKSFRFIEKVGLVCNVIFNSNVLEDIKNKAYKYISAVITKPTAKTKIPLVFGAALTNNPAVDFKIEPIAALTAFGIQLEAEKEKNSEMPELKRIAETLKLTENATEDQIIETITGIYSEKEGVEKFTNELCSLLDVKESEIIECTKKILADKKEADEKIVKLTAEKSNLEIERVLDGAQVEGRITKADREKWKVRLTKDFETVKEIINDLSKDKTCLTSEEGIDPTNDDSSELVDDRVSGKKIEASGVKLHNLAKQIQNKPENKGMSYGEAMKIADATLNKKD